MLGVGFRVWSIGCKFKRVRGINLRPTSISVNPRHFLPGSSPTGQGSVPIMAESETKFFPTQFDAEIEFVKDDQGKVTGIVLRQGGQETKGARK